MATFLAEVETERDLVSQAQQGDRLPDYAQRVEHQATEKSCH